MTEREFYELFLQMIQNDPNLQTSYFDYFFFQKDLLKAIKKQIIQKEMNIASDKKIFQVDLLGYDVEDVDDKRMKKEGKEFNVKSNLWHPEIAIDHVTDSKEWVADLINLTYIRCPFKVIITYANYDERDHDLALLAYATRWMIASNGFDVGAKEKYLIIVGNQGNKKVKDQMDDVCDYRGYYFDYQTNEFTKISNDVKEIDVSNENQKEEKPFFKETSE